MENQFDFLEQLRAAIASRGDADAERALEALEKDGLFAKLSALREMAGSLGFSLNVGLDPAEAPGAAPAGDARYSNIAQALSSGFESVYYVDIDTGHYTEYISEGQYKTLRIERSGDTFFEDTQRNLTRVVHPDDQARTAKAFERAALLREASGDRVYSIGYRLMIEGRPAYYSAKVVRTADGRHLVVGVANVDADVQRERERQDAGAQSRAFAGIVQALSSGFDSIYYVDLRDDSYDEYTSQGEYENLQIDTAGKSFFEETARNLPLAVHPEDQPKLAAALRKSALLQALADGNRFTLAYRLMIGGAPVWYRLTAAYPAGGDDSHIIVGVSNIESKVRQDEAQLQSMTYSRIAQALSKDYFSIYYVNTETDEFVEYSSNASYQTLKVEQSGDDFFGASQRNIMRVVYPEDREKALTVFQKEALMRELAAAPVYTISYRLMIEDRPVYIQIKALRPDGDDSHIIVGISNIDAQRRREEELERAHAQHLTYSRIASALTQDYYTVYHVDVETEHFMEFSMKGHDHALQLVREGENFFADCQQSIRMVVHPEDQDVALSAFDRERLLSEVENGKTFTIAYRLMFGGVQVYSNLKALQLSGTNGREIVIGLSNIDAQMKRQAEFERAQAESLTYSRIAQALAADYFSIYYVDTDTDRFIEYSSHDEYQALNIEKGGEDFFALSRKNVLRVAYPEDHEKILSAFTKENLLRELALNGTFTMSYRLMFSGQPTYVSMKATRMQDRNDNHIVIGVSNIDAQMKRQAEFERARAESLTYSRIAQALSKDYYSIYLVNTETDEFIEYSSHSDYQDLQVEQSGEHFFEDCRRNIMRLVYPEDLEKALSVWEKERLLPELEDGQTFSTTYRLMFDGVPRYINAKVIRMSDDEGDRNIVIGVSNVDAQMRREQEHARQLNTAREIANRDSLTGVKSKHAWSEAEQAVNEQIANGSAPEFAVAVCDVNGLKAVNDLLGHKAGDKYIQDACALICATFKHSPVFRIGGDEFVVLMQGADYENRAGLVSGLRERILFNQDNGGVIVASGVSDFDPARDAAVASVFERADALMYANKKSLKGARED